MRRRLRKERERRGLSLRQLAGEVGISPSALSQIETGRSRPSVTTLYAIVTALELSFDGLFAGELPDRRGSVARPAISGPGGVFVHRAGAGESMEFMSGVRWDRLSAPGDPVEVLWLTYPPGAASGEAGQLSRHAGSEYGLVVQGRLAVSLGFETYELGAGDAIAFESEVPHQLRTLDDRPAIALWFVRSDESVLDTRGGAS